MFQDPFVSTYAAFSAFSEALVAIIAIYNYLDVHSRITDLPRQTPGQHNLYMCAIAAARPPARTSETHVERRRRT